MNRCWADRHRNNNAHKLHTYSAHAYKKMIILTRLEQGPAAGTVFVKEVPRQHDHITTIFFGQIQDFFQGCKGIITADIVRFGITEMVVRADEYPQGIRIGFVQNDAVGW